MKCTTLTLIKTAGITILISDRADFKIRKLIKDKESHYVIIKWPILQEDETMLNAYVCLTTVYNNRTPLYVRQKLTGVQRPVDESTIIVGDFNIPLLERDGSSGLKISADTVELNTTIHQLGVIDMDKLLHPTKGRIHILFRLIGNIYHNRLPSGP